MLLPFINSSSPPPAYEQTTSSRPDSTSKALVPSTPSASSSARQAEAIKGLNMNGIIRDRSVAKTRSGSFGFGNKHGVELSMNIGDNLVFLYPNSEEGSYTDSEAIGQRPRATFIVSITLSIADGIPRPPPIESLTVQLKGLESLGFPQGGLEQNIILYATKKVQEARNLELLPGSAYRWDVPIEISHDVAPYERMRYGRVFQKMSVHLKWSTKTIFFSKYKDLSVERDVCIACIPRISNMLDYGQTHRTENQHLGSLVIHVRSHHLTVGSYLRLGLYLPQLRQKNIKIIKMELSMKQYTSLHSRKRQGVVYQSGKPEYIPVLEVLGDEFEEKMGLNSYANWIARIPSCHQMRPSTLSGSKGAAIKVSHRMEVKILFVPEGHDKEKPITYSAQWPVIVPSCTCRWRSLKLPSYSQIDDSPLPYEVHETNSADLYAGITFRGKFQSHLSQDDCTCGISMEQMHKFEDEYEEAQNICFTALMEQEMLANPAVTTTAWEDRYPEGNHQDSTDTALDLTAIITQ